MDSFRDPVRNGYHYRDLRTTARALQSLHQSLMPEPAFTASTTEPLLPLWPTALNYAVRRDNLPKIGNESCRLLQRRRLPWDCTQPKHT